MTSELQRKSPLLKRMVTIAAVSLLACSGALAAHHDSNSLFDELVNRPTVIDPTAAVVVGFSPGVDGYRAEDVVIQAITEAKRTVRMAAYSFTSKPIASALLAAKRRGVDVKIIVDRKENSGRYSAAIFAANEGIPTRTDSHYSIMHNKFLVLDGTAIETGSFNYTAAAATKNAENALLLRNVPVLASKYSKEWQRLWAESDDLAPRY